jgi:osmotically-inducible protein OsmY
MNIQSRFLLVLVMLTACSHQSAPDYYVIKEPLFESSAKNKADLSQAIYDMKQHIRNDPEISNYSIRVEVYDRATSLFGEVKNVSERKRIEEIAMFFIPENKIINSITLKEPVPDNELIERVRLALANALPKVAPKVGIDASDGKVILSGIPGSSHEIDHILSIVLDTPGVEEIENNLQVD